MSLREIFAHNLKAERRAKGLSQEDLAGLAEIDRTYVSLLERSEYSASIDMVEKLAKALDIAPTKLMQKPTDNCE